MNRAMSLNSVIGNREQLIGARASSWRRMWSRLTKNRKALIGAIMVFLIVFLAVFANWISPYAYQQADFTSLNQGPSLSHILGTDSLGRDLFTRINYGLRSVCIVGFGAEFVELTVGVMVGALAAYKGGWVDNVLMRLVDAVASFPSFLISMILVTMMGRILPVMLLAVAATSWVGMARVVRSQVLRVRQTEYIQAARSMGASSLTIILRYILPNAMGPIVVAVSFGIPANMMAEAGLSLVGLGINPPTPDLGVMISEGQQSIMSYPWQLIGPVGVFIIALLGFTFLGDGLRDMFDTRSRR